MAESAPKKGPPALGASSALEAAVGKEEVELPAEVLGADAAEIRARARQLENATRQVQTFFSPLASCLQVVLSSDTL